MKIGDIVSSDKEGKNRSKISLFIKFKNGLNGFITSGYPFLKGGCVIYMDGISVGRVIACKVDIINFNYTIVELTKEIYVENQGNFLHWYEGIHLSSEEIYEIYGKGSVQLKEKGKDKISEIVERYTGLFADNFHFQYLIKSKDISYGDVLVVKKPNGYIPLGIVNVIGGDFTLFNGFLQCFIEENLDYCQHIRDINWSNIDKWRDDEENGEEPNLIQKISRYTSWFI
jgi:hypothetical protein